MKSAETKVFNFIEERINATITRLGISNSSIIYTTEDNDKSNAQARNTIFIGCSSLDSKQHYPVSKDREFILGFFVILNFVAYQYRGKKFTAGKGDNPLNLNIFDINANIVKELYYIPSHPNTLEEVLPQVSGDLAQYRIIHSAHERSMYAYPKPNIIEIKNDFLWHMNVSFDTTQESIAADAHVAVRVNEQPLVPTTPTPTNPRRITTEIITN